MTALSANLLRVEGLTRHFFRPRQVPFGPRQVVRAVEDVDLYIRPAETLGLVGESGCGKSTTGRIVTGIDQPTRGTVTFDGRDLSQLSKAELHGLRRNIQMIFQNPVSALDPRVRVGLQIREALDIHDIGTPGDRGALVEDLLRSVGLDPSISHHYPHQISGGQAQRIIIARALSLQPRLLVCDEPVSALDVSVQAQVVRLLADLQSRLGVAYLFISHDLKVVKRLSHRIAVMYLGQIVEEGPTEAIFRTPRHPYTKALISAVPDTDVHARRQRILLSGDLPSPLAPPSGCRFHTRCPFARPRCSSEEPQRRNMGNGQMAKCHFAEELETLP
jgi:peptide/nickel transport system ATP-binding protein/oligopeptide transport system ATP-binding protein